LWKRDENITFFMLHDESPHTMHTRGMRMRSSLSGSVTVAKMELLV
jgi:hypothetical protein